VRWTRVASPAVFRCLRFRERNLRISQSLPAIKAPMHQGIGGKLSCPLGIPAPSTGRDEANNPLYWRFAYTASGFTHLPELRIGPNLLTKS
jgi:hypothetical protein